MTEGIFIKAHLDVFNIFIMDLKNINEALPIEELGMMCVISTV